MVIFEKNFYLNPHEAQTQLDKGVEYRTVIWGKKPDKKSPNTIGLPGIMRGKIMQLKKFLKFVP